MRVNVIIELHSLVDMTSDREKSDIVKRFLETIKYNLYRFHLNTQLCKHQGYRPIHVGLCLMQACESWNFSFDPKYHYSELCLQKEVCLMCRCE